jgi:hypothetical protein
MTKDHWRIILESVFIHVNVCTAHPAITHLDFDLFVSAVGLFHILQLDIPKAALIFD